MLSFSGEVIDAGSGRTVVRFTTPSGVQAAIATSIAPEALARFAKQLARKIVRRERRQADAASGRKRSRG